MASDLDHTSDDANAQLAKKLKTDDHGNAHDDAQQKAGGEIFAASSTHDLMPLYYRTHFPYEAMYTWLAYGHALPTTSTTSTSKQIAVKKKNIDRTFFPRREFCFTLEGDVFVRYQSFKDVHEMKKAIRERVPAKIDIGPVFSADPSRRHAYSAGTSFVPMEREFVIDIDMTDYDDVRAGAASNNLAASSDDDWAYMTAAIAVLDAALKSDLGFKHILWVYSGRRGVHCWVCDRRARMMNDEVRSAVAAYLQVYKGTEAGRARLTGNLGHPSVKRCLRETLRPLWPTVIDEQQMLERSESIEKALALIPDEDVASALRDRWSRGSKKSSDRWQELESAVTRAASSKKGLDAIKLRECPNVIILSMLYPRLDVEVSKHMNHLLKAPFCVHPKTGRVCVPIVDAQSFKPQNAPTLLGLLRQEITLDEHVSRFLEDFVHPMLADEAGEMEVDAPAAPTTPGGASW